MIKEIIRMPVSITIMLTWIIVWALVVTNKNVFPAMCGKGISVVGNEYYRFFTAGLTHFHVLHMLFNVISMFWIGYLYENYIGSIRFLLIAVICAVATQVIFLCIYSGATESIGGSGYNFAFIGFGLTMQFLVPNFPKLTFGTWSGDWLIISAILGNFPIFSFMNITTFIFHLIAFALGVCAALICWLSERTK